MIQVLWNIRKMIKIDLKSIYKIIMIKENNNWKMSKKCNRKPKEI